MQSEFSTHVNLSGRPAPLAGLHNSSDGVFESACVTVGRGAGRNERSKRKIPGD